MKKRINLPPRPTTLTTKPVNNGLKGRSNKGVDRAV